MPANWGKKVNWKTVFNIFTITLSVSLLAYFCLSDNGLVTLMRHFREFKTVWLAAAFLCMLADLFLDTCLIYEFTRGLRQDYTFARAFKVCMVGHLYSAITPFQSGGQPMQIYVMTKQQVDAGTATSALIQKFFVYQTGIALYSLFAIVFQFAHFKSTLTALMWSLTIIGFAAQILMAGLLMIISFNQKITRILLTALAKLLAKIHLIKDYQSTIQSWEKQIDIFHQGNQDLYKNKRMLIKTYVLTFLQLTALFTVSYCIYRSFSIGRVPAVNMICSQAFVTMISSLIPLPGAAGASEGSFYVFFSGYFTPETVKSAILLWRVITYYAVILISAPFSRIAKKM